MVASARLQSSQWEEAMAQSDGPKAGASGSARSRCIALVGPYLSGKTTLLESILARTGAIQRAGSVPDKSSVGDASPEARSHGMSVSLNVADVSFLGDNFTFIDCPGSIEFQYEGALALTACDAAVVVCEADPKRVPALQIILKQLEDRGIPHFLFLNKIDESEVPLRELIPVLQPASTKPLVLRQIPIWENGVATGFVDLASERAFIYRTNAPSEVVELPASVSEREKEARFHMLEQLADHDDELMEQLLSDMPPPTRQGLPRPDAGIPRRPHLPGAARLGARQPRHLPALESAAPRSPDGRDHGAALEAGERQVRRLRDEVAAYGARRQALARTRADR